MYFINFKRSTLLVPKDSQAILGTRLLVTYILGFCYEQDEKVSAFSVPFALFSNLLWAVLWYICKPSIQSMSYTDLPLLQLFPPRRKHCHFTFLTWVYCVCYHIAFLFLVREGKSITHTMGTLNSPSLPPSLSHTLLFKFLPWHISAFSRWRGEGKLMCYNVGKYCMWQASGMTVTSANHCSFINPNYKLQDWCDCIVCYCENECSAEVSQWAGKYMPI